MFLCGSFSAVPSRLTAHPTLKRLQSRSFRYPYLGQFSRFARKHLHPLRSISSHGPNQRFGCSLTLGTAVPRMGTACWLLARGLIDPFWGSFLALLENIRSERLFLTHAPLVMLGAYPSVAFGDSSPFHPLRSISSREPNHRFGRSLNQGEPFCFAVSSSQFETRRSRVSSTIIHH